MKLAREGLPTIGGAAFMAAGGWLISPWITLLMLLPLALALWFYRDPERVPDGKGWVSPADGRVIELEEAHHEFTGRAIKIGIFMNGLDVHVNRFPTAAKVEYTSYVPGKKWFAIVPKASEVNERFYVGGDSENGRFVLVQIAGILARRISVGVKNGDTLDRGQRYGMIKLGSKVDLYLPPAVKPVVKIGDAVKAGETVVGVVDE